MERRDGVLQMTLHTDGKALRWGLVPHAERAWILAEQLAGQPTLMLRYTRVVFTDHIKRQMQEFLGYGLALEGMALMERPMSSESA